MTDDKKISKDIQEELEKLKAFKNSDLVKVCKSDSSAGLSGKEVQRKIFLVSDERFDKDYQYAVNRVEITSEELSQFLSKELVLRKIDELENKIKEAEKEHLPLGTMRDKIYDQIEILNEILNECSSKENSLLKKLEAFSLPEKELHEKEGAL